MALTPEDVVNKRFQPTKFREGYDQDEVDDFLDEVVGELRRLTSENDDLRQKLSASEQRVSELSRGGAAGTPAAAAAAPTSSDQEAAPATGEHAATPTDAENSDATGAGTSATAADVNPAGADDPAGTSSVPIVAKDETAPSETATASVADDSASTASPANDSSSNALTDAATGPGAADATGLITLAQRLHDEHVQKGQEKRDQLIAEAQTQASGMVEEAEKKRSETLSSLEEEKSMLERKIDRLRDFERQYRTRLKSYLQDQLRDLDSRGSLVPESLGDEPGQP